MAATEASPTQRIVTSRDELNQIASRYRKKSKHSFGSVTRKLLFWLLIAIIVIYSLFPFYWAIVSSLTPDSLLYKTPVKFWPQAFTWDHYSQVLRDGGFLRALLNSTIVSTVTVLLALFFGTVGAYALGRLHFRGRTIILYLILSMTMFPAVAIIGSLFIFVRQLHLYNTLIALIITYLSFSLPFTVWVLTNFFKAMPDELEQAAMVDGATPLRALWQILLPMAVPGLVTTGLLAFIAAWSEFLYALTFTIPGGNNTTVQVAIANFSGRTQFEQPFALKMAAAVVVTIPLLVGVLLVQRRIVSGLTAGAIKG
jgi:trehalose/maltose transport system permease protein